MNVVGNPFNFSYHNLALLQIGPELWMENGWMDYNLHPCITRGSALKNNLIIARFHLNMKCSPRIFTS